MIILIQTIKWMPPYWGNKALSTPTLTIYSIRKTLFYFIFNFLIISFFFIENKRPSNVILDLKREKKSFAKGMVERVKKHTSNLQHWSWLTIDFLSFWQPGPIICC